MEFSNHKQLVDAELTMVTRKKDTKLEIHCSQNTLRHLGPLKTTHRDTAGYFKCSRETQ